jgi:hypothetical protein
MWVAVKLPAEIALNEQNGAARGGTERGQIQLTKLAGKPRDFSSPFDRSPVKSSHRAEQTAGAKSTQLGSSTRSTLNSTEA